MNLFTKVIFALFTFSVFSIAAEQRRADIYVDDIIIITEYLRIKIAVDGVKINVGERIATRKCGTSDTR